MSPSRLHRAGREASGLVAIAAPLVAAQISTVAMTFVDTVMSGRLSAEALASVAVGGSVWATLMLFIIGVLMALPPTISQLAGGGRMTEMGPATRQTLWLGLGLAALGIAALRSSRPVLDLLEVQPELIPTVLGYLRAISWGLPALCIFLALRFLAEGLAYTRPAMYFGFLGVPVNVLGNWVLMYGHWGFPALGAVGCGYATTLVLWTQALGMALLVARGRRFREIGLFSRFDPPRWNAIAELLHIGLPIGMAFFMEVSLFASVSLLMASISTVAVAGHQVAINFASLTFMVPLGLSMGITVRVGHAVGRGDGLAARRAGWVGIGLALLLQTVSATVMFTLPEQIVAIYTQDAAVASMAAQLILMAAVFQLSDGIQVSSAGALRGLKDTRVPLVITFVAYWVIGLPLGWWLGFRADLGPRGLWMGLIAGLTVAAVLLSARFLLLSRRLAAGAKASPMPGPG